MSWAGREHERPTGMTCAQGRSCEFRGRGESKREGSINFFIHIESSYVNMILLKIEKNNHHGNNNYYTHQRIMGHIIWCWIVIKTVDESTGSQLALNSPSSSHSRRSIELHMIVISFTKSGVSCAVKLWRGGVLQSFDIPSRVNSGGSRLETQGGPTIFFTAQHISC
jgi:hypothetical protein